MEKKTGRIVMTLSGTLVTAMVYATVVNCFSLFIIPVCSDLGFSRGGYNVALTLMYITYMVGSMASGRIYGRHSLKGLMEVSSLSIPVVYFLLSYASSLPLFFLGYMLIGLFLPYISFAVFSVIIHDWFLEAEGEGTAVGVAFMGSGIGGMVLNILVARWIENYGWRMAVRFSSVLIALAAIPIAFFVIRPCHENFGVSSGAEGKGNTRVPGIWRLLLLTLAGGFGLTIMSQTIPPHIQDLGYSTMYAAGMNSAFMGCLCLSKILMGIMFDKWGVRRTMAFSLLLGISGAVAYYLGGVQVLHPLMVIGGSWACSLGSVAIPILARYMCSPEHFASASGSAAAFNYLGSAMAPFFMNTLYDSVGSYRPGYILSALLFVAVGCLVPWGRRGREE